MEAFEIGQKFAGEYPPEAASWCDAHGCWLALDESGDVAVYTIEEAELPEPVFAPPSPTAEELAEAATELGDMMAKLHESMQTCMDALAEIGDMVAAMSE